MTQTPEPNEIGQLFIDACPSAAASWAEHLEFWGADERGVFNDIAAFVHHTVECYESGDFTAIERVFDLVERLLGDSSEETKGLIVFGYLETLQNHASHRKYGYQAFERFLGEQSMAEWRKLEIMWEGKSSLMDMIRAERGE